MHAARIAFLAGLILCAQAPRAAFAGQHTWDVGEVFSNADGTIQFVELFEANGSPGETGVGSNSISSNAKSFSWANGAVAPPTTNKRYLIASQTFANLTGAPTPNAILSTGVGGVLPFFFLPGGDTVSFSVYDSCTFVAAIPTNGLGARDCVSNTNTPSNSPTNYAGPPGSVIAAINVGLLDNFTNATLQNWEGGSSPTNQATNGPAGPGDRFLQISSAGGPLGTFNQSQWAGNAIAAGVEAIEANLKNLGGNAVSIRLMLFTPGCEDGPPLNCTAWTSTDATDLAANSGWVLANFSLAEADLTLVHGTDSYAASLANIERVLIRHDPDGPSGPGTPIGVASTLGIDNVLPEPSAAAGLAAGAALLALLRRRS